MARNKMNLGDPGPLIYKVLLDLLLLQLKLQIKQRCEDRKEKCLDPKS